MTRAERDWAEIIRNIDVITAMAAALDRERRNVTLDEVAHGFSELARLRSGGEPDYNARGLGTAYLLYYLARRALNTADACLSLGELTGEVRVLDIGAGTNAGALALAAAFPVAHFDVVALEPSGEMAASGSFAATELENVSLRPVLALLDDVLDQRVLPDETFDLVMMSAMLPYGWRKETLVERVEFGERLLMRLRPGGRLLVIEPRAKLDELETFERCLDRTGIEYELGETNISGEDNRLLVACTKVFWTWYPAVSHSSNLSREALAMLGGDKPHTLRAGSIRPDVVLSGVRRIGPVTNDPSPPRIQRLQAPPSRRSMPALPRTRLTRSLPISARPMVVWGVGAMAAVAAIAVGVLALL